MPRTGDNIYQLPDGRWAAPLHHEGLRLKVFYGKTRTEAKKKRDAGRLTLLQGGTLNPARETTGAYLDRWLSDWIKPNRAEGTCEAYSKCIARMKPHIGKVKLAKLTAGQIQAMYGKLTEAGLAPTTIALMRRVLRAALNHAMNKEKLISSNPALETEPPKVPEKAYRFLTEEEAGRFLRLLKGHRYEALFAVALSLGLRLNEIRSLTWRDVDMEGGRLEVRGTKTKGSRRTVPLFPEIVAVLKRHKAMQIEMLIYHGIQWEPSLPVFTTEKGTSPDESALRKFLLRTLEKAGIERMRFHELRHSCASLLLAMGVPMKAVQEILGHSNIGTTMNVYGHLMPGALSKEIGKMGRFFGPEDEGTLHFKASEGDVDSSDGREMA